MPPTWGSTWSPLSTKKPHRPLTTLLRGERRFIFRVILQGQGKNLRSNFDCLKAFASPLSIWWGRKSFFQCWSINFFLRNYDIFSNYVKWISCWVVLVQKSITMLWRWKIYLLSWSFPFYEWCLSILYLRKNGVLSLIRALLLSALQDQALPFGIAPRIPVGIADSVPGTLASPFWGNHFAFFLFGGS